MAANQPVEFTLRLTNRLATPRTVVLEPWTGQYRLPPGGQLDIKVEGVPHGALEVEIIEDEIVVYSFDSEGALLTAYRDGKELSSEHMPPTT